MDYKKPKSELISVRAKINKENYIEIDKYCQSSNITVSAYIRSLIEKEKPGVSSIRKAGINFIRFNPITDSFVWEIHYDDNSKIEVANELSDSFLENLKVSIEKSLNNRKEHIKKRLSNSVVIPSKINKLNGRGDNVKS